MKLLGGQIMHITTFSFNGSKLAVLKEYNPTDGVVDVCIRKGRMVCLISGFSLLLTGPKVRSKIDSKKENQK